MDLAQRGGCGGGGRLRQLRRLRPRLAVRGRLGGGGLTRAAVRLPRRYEPAHDISARSPAGAWIRVWTSCSRSERPFGAWPFARPLDEPLPAFGASSGAGSGAGSGSGSGAGARSKVRSVGAPPFVGAGRGLFSSRARRHRPVVKIARVLGSSGLLQSPHHATRPLVRLPLRRVALRRLHAIAIQTREVVEARRVVRLVLTT